MTSHDLPERFVRAAMCHAARSHGAVRHCDISDAKSVLQELRAIVPDLPSVPVQPIILAMQEEPGMFDLYRHRPSFLTVHRYTSQEQLLADLGEKVIRPAELKVLELRG